MTKLAMLTGTALGILIVVQVTAAERSRTTVIPVSSNSTCASSTDECACGGCATGGSCIQEQQNTWDRCCSSVQTAAQKHRVKWYQMWQRKKKLQHPECPPFFEANWGYHPTCWRKFPPICNPCPPAANGGEGSIAPAPTPAPLPLTAPPEPKKTSAILDLDSGSGLQILGPLEVKLALPSRPRVTQASAAKPFPSKAERAPTRSNRRSPQNQP